MKREVLGEFGFPSRPQVVKQLGPGLKARASKDALKLCPEIAVGLAVAGNDVLSSRLSRLKDFAQVGQEFREDWDRPRRFAFMMLSLGTAYGHLIAFPIHIAPAQCQMFGRAAQARIPAQGKDQSPLSIWAGGQHLVGVSSAHEIQPLGIRAHRTLHAVEWVSLDQLPPNRSMEELPCTSAHPPDGVLTQTLAQQSQAESIGVAGGDGGQGPTFAEVLHHLALRAI